MIFSSLLVKTCLKPVNQIVFENQDLSVSSLSSAQTPYLTGRGPIGLVNARPNTLYHSANNNRTKN